MGSVRSQNLVSHHLRALRAQELVTYRRVGKIVMYALTVEGRRLLAAVLPGRVGRVTTTMRELAIEVLVRREDAERFVESSGVSGPRNYTSFASCDRNSRAAPVRKITVGP